MEHKKALEEKKRAMEEEKRRMDAEMARKEAELQAKLEAQKIALEKQKADQEQREQMARLEEVCRVERCTSVGKGLLLDIGKINKPSHLQNATYPHSHRKSDVCNTKRNWQRRSDALNRRLRNVRMKPTWQR